MRAVVLDERGEPEVAELPEPEGPGEPLRVRACGLCGSDVEKLRPEFAGTVLGHEVVAETADGRRVALVAVLSLELPQPADNAPTASAPTASALQV